MSVLIKQVEKVRRDITEDERHDLNQQVTKDYLEVESLKSAKKESGKEWDAKIIPIQKRLNQNSRISKEGVMEEDRQVFCLFDFNKEEVKFFEDADGSIPAGSRPMTDDEIENPNLFGSETSDEEDEEDNEEEI